MIPDLSIVLPCFRAAPAARRSVQELQEALATLGVASYEILVVDDGGGDFGVEAWHRGPRTRLLALPANQGKGAAVCAGMAVARGHVRIFTDVDLPYGADLIPCMMDYMNRGFHLVIGDRTMPTSRYREAIGWSRRLVSSLSSRAIGTLVTGGFFDTQCGLKAVRGDVADCIFPLVRLRRFAFDVELIYIALLHRLDIKRIPVQLVRNETSSVRVLRDSLRGARDILSIKYHQTRGHYECADLRDLVLQEFAGARAVHA